MASISVVDAAREAAEHTRRHLLPVNPLKWLTLGLLAFLDQCGRSVTGGGPQGPNGVHVDPGVGPTAASASSTSSARRPEPAPPGSPTMPSWWPSARPQPFSPSPPCWL